MRRKMKTRNWIKSCAVFLLSAVSVSVSAATVECTLDFENYVTGTNTYFQGTVPAGTSGGNYAGLHTIQTAAGSVTLTTDWANWGLLYPGYGYADAWSWGGGFTVSGVNAENTSAPRTTTANGIVQANGAYVHSSNDFAAVAGTTNYPDANYGLTVSGANGSSGYAVLFGSSDTAISGGTLSFSQPVSLKSIDYTNTVGVLAVETFGDTFSQKASDGNWAALIMQGWNAAGEQVGQKVLMLHDYLVGDSIVDSWMTADLENFETKLYDPRYYGVDASDADYQQMVEDVANGIFLANGVPYLADAGTFEDISSLTFTFNGSDAGMWGLNFPTYAALDDLVFSYLGEAIDPDDPNVPPIVPPVGPGVETNVPEPAGWLLLVLAAGLGFGIRRKK
ncbi:MAG: DUF4465 domain-containing protein [Planctomycetaceae bacterium]|nr:DUF4465 domain-containing protein [Planctomycetaceae bacterium]